MYNFVYFSSGDSLLNATYFVTLDVLDSRLGSFIRGYQPVHTSKNGLSKVIKYSLLEG